MGRHVVLLRGINVGGKNKLPMADLRASLTAAGFGDVSTYIQSGNVAVDGERCTAEEISQIIEADFGLTIPVVVRTADQLAATIADNPFPDVTGEPKKLNVFFCSDDLSGDELAGFDVSRFPGDRIAVGAAHVYVAYGEAMSASKLGGPVIERAIGQATTARNWNTVLKLAEMAGVEP